MFMVIISLFTGLFKELMMLLIIIFIHEIGHITMALFYKWDIFKIVILPTGCLTVFNERLNRPIREEFVIAIMGPIFQMAGYFLFKGYDNYLFTGYNYGLLFFNLLPIYPLDGSRILSLWLQTFLSYKISHLIMIGVSLFGIILISITCFMMHISLIFVLVVFCLVLKVMGEIKDHYSIVKKFQFERYLYKMRFKKMRCINGTNLNKMYRDCGHFFYNGNYYVTERYLLYKTFDFERNI